MPGPWPFLQLCLALAVDVAAGGPYLWPHSRGNVGSYSLAKTVRGPRNLSKAFLWKWHHPHGRFHTTVVGGAIFDDAKNIYLAAEDGIRKFSADGQLLWYHNARSTGTIPGACSIMDGHVYACAHGGLLFKLRMDTGKEVWRRRVAENTPGDTLYVSAQDNVVVAGWDRSWTHNGGATFIGGYNASDSVELWRFTPDVPSWNFQAQFGGDGTFVFQDLEGKAYRVRLHDGSLVWKAGGAPGTFSDGGPLIAGDMVYSVAADVSANFYRPDAPGHVFAFRYADGALVWHRRVPRIPNSWPVVGPLQPGAAPSLVIPLGMQGGQPPISWLPNWMPMPAKLALHLLSLALGDYQGWLWEPLGMTATYPLDVAAMDAATGQKQWLWEGPVHRRVACGGDEEGVAQRFRLGIREICWPGPWSAPTMDAAGTVFVGAQNGWLYAIWDGAKGVDKFDVGASALHPGPALVPGLLAYPTCDGLFVFKAD